MNSVSSNYQVNFRALVPKAQYSGTPKLPRKAINEIKKLKESLKETDREIIDLERNLNNPDNRGLIMDYLAKRLEIFNDYREKIAIMIDDIKKHGCCNDKQHYKWNKEHAEEVEKLEEQFARASKHPEDPFMMIG